MIPCGRGRLPVASRLSTFALGAVDGVGDAVAGWEEDGNEEGDGLDEKTFVSGTVILTHFRLNVRRRSVDDLGLSSAVLGFGGAAGVYNVGGRDVSVP